MALNQKDNLRDPTAQFTASPAQNEGHIPRRPPLADLDLCVQCLTRQLILIFRLTSDFAQPIKLEIGYAVPSTHKEKNKHTDKCAPSFGA